MFKINIKMMKGEYWYGGHTNWGVHMPVGRGRIFKVDTTFINSGGQANTLLVSNKGRVIYSEEGFLTKFFLGNITCTSALAPINLYQAQDATLRGAFLYASKNFMPPDGKHPNKLMFTIPQYCTWIQLDINQNQKDILAYAQSILDCGMPAGELIIDDGWQTTFGDWTFRKDNFSDAKAMISQLREMGFKVILWVVPFVRETASEYQYLVQNDLLVKDKKGDIAKRVWWNGTDAILDFSNPKAQEWFFKQTDFLIKEYDVSGFKQDAGDALYYCDDDINFGKLSANKQSEVWALSSRRYDFNELRACFKCGGIGVAQRLADKGHVWKNDGLGVLIPNTLTQGISGYAFTCPDMIGGGIMGHFRDKDPSTLDHELFARYCQTSALMPMMQYSLNIWDLGNETTKKVCQTMTALHTKFSEYIIDYVVRASISGEPIVRYMEYSFAGRGYAKIKSQFVLGDDYIVAPVLKKGERVKKVYVPEGQWEYKGKIYSNEVAEIACEIDELIYLTKVKAQ